MPNTKRATRFDAVAREIFSWDAAILWIALDEPGRQLQLEWRNCDIDSTGTGITPAHLTIDPLLFMLAANSPDIYHRSDRVDPQHLRFVVLAYAGYSQIVAKLGRYGQLNIGMGLAGDAYEVGSRLARLLDSMEHPSSSATAKVTQRQTQDPQFCPA